MKRVVAVLVLLGMATGAVQAGLEAGRREIQLQGMLSSFGEGTTVSDDVQNLNGSLILNYFIGANVSIGVVGMFDVTKSDSYEQTTVFGLGRMDLYLGSSSTDLVPFVGGRGGMAFTKSDGSDLSTTLTVGGQAGFKIFASENTSWNIEASYTLWQPDDGDTKFHQAGLSVGFSYYF